MACIQLKDFIAAWRGLVGEPPAIMLDSRSEMIRLLVESIPVAPPNVPEGAECYGDVEAHNGGLSTLSKAQVGAIEFHNVQSTSCAVADNQRLRSDRPSPIGML